MTGTLISSSVLILIITILRTVFRGRIKSSVRYALWLIAAVRLMLPFGIAESPVSVMNLFPAASAEIRYTAPDEEPFAGESENRSAVMPEKTLKIVWLAVASALIIWSAAVNIRFYISLRRTRRPAKFPAPLKIYITDEMLSPCIFGFPVPSVYLPPACEDNEKARSYAVLHELCHYYHGDMFWAFLRCLLLAVYWFDPFVWAAAILSKQDCECACDEAVIRRIGEAERFEYGKTIIDFIPGEHGDIFGAASSMTSGKNALKERMKLISGKTENKAYAVICTAAAAAIAAVCTFTSAKIDIYAVPDEPPPAAADAAVPAGKLLRITAYGGAGAENAVYYITAPESVSSPPELTRADVTVFGRKVTLIGDDGQDKLFSLINSAASLFPEYCTVDISGENIGNIPLSDENGGFSSSIEIGLYNTRGRPAASFTADGFSSLLSFIRPAEDSKAYPESGGLYGSLLSLSGADGFESAICEKISGKLSPENFEKIFQKGIDI